MRMNEAAAHEAEMLEDMIRLQADLDRVIFRAHGMTGYQDIKSNDLNSAIFDEVGELNHELKPQWCWWKKCEPVNCERVLEEFTDVVHFVLMRALKLSSTEELVKGFRYEATGLLNQWQDNRCAYRELARDYGWGAFKDGVILYRVAQQLEFTWEEVYEAYKKKNETNRRRARNGY